MQASRAFGVPEFHVPVTLCISSAVEFVAPGVATAVSRGPRPSLALERSTALPRAVGRGAQRRARGEGSALAPRGSAGGLSWSGRAG